MTEDDINREVARLQAAAGDEAVLSLKTKRAFLVEIALTPLGSVSQDNAVAQQVTIRRAHGSVEEVVNVKIPCRL